MFGEKVKYYRMQRGLTQTQLAKALGVSLRTIQNYESNSALPKSSSVVQGLSAYLGVPVDELISTEDIYRLVGKDFHKTKKQEDSFELFRVLQEVTALFAGGKLSRGDRELFLRAVQDLYNEAMTEGSTPEEKQ